MKIKVKNISNVDQTYQIDGINYRTAKPGDIVEREFKDEKHIPVGWEVVNKTPAAVVDTPAKPKGRNAATVITEDNQKPTSNDGVTTSSAIKI